MAKATKTPITDALARELGYKDAKELKSIMQERNSGSLKQRFESGQGIREAVFGSFAEKTTQLKKTFTKKGMKGLERRAYRTVFQGDDLLSSYMRGRIESPKTLKEKLPLASPSDSESVSGGGDSEFTRIIAKESMSLPGMARDMNVMRQNIQKLVKLWSSKEDTEAAKGKPYEQGADEFFMREEQKEAQLEAARGGKKDVSPTPEKDVEETKGGMLDKIMSFFSNGFMKAIKTIFNPKMLMKVFSKVFLPVAIIGTLFSGIMDGFKKYQETGSFKDAIVSGLGGMLKFLSFGLFGEDTIKSLFDSISNFFSPITDTISEIFTGIKNFFIKLFGGDVKVEDKAPAKMEEVKPKVPNMKPSETGEAGKSGETSKLSAPTDTPTAAPTSTSTSTPTPTPVVASKTETKVVEKISGIKIKLPPGVRYDQLTNSMVYKGIYFTANAQEDLDKMVKSIDDKSSIEFQGKDESGKSVTIKFDGATGSQTISAGKETATPISTSSDSSGVSSGGGSVSASGGSSGGGSVSASGGSASSGEVSSGQTTPSGSSVSSTSSDVAESQRMESAADQGSVVNAPTTNNSSKTKQDSGKTKAADVYDSDLASILVTT